MGLYDREYYQDEYGSPGTGMGGGSRMMVTNIVILTAAVFVVNLFTTNSSWLMETLAASPDVLKQPWYWWKFLTYGFAHDPTAIGHVFWNMFGLWIFGRDVEGIYGPKEFLRIYLVALVLGSVVWAVRATFLRDPNTIYLLWGASGAVTTIILLFVFHFPRRTILLFFVLPVPAWILGLIIIGGDVLHVFSGGAKEGVAFDVHLVGAAFAVAYFHRHWNLGRIVPDFSSWKGRMRVARARRRFKVHDPDQAWDQEEVADRILAKVAEQGMDSLTSKEKRILEEYSRRVRERRGKDR
jgi:membrane associated rhomboid family serine protease